MVVRYFEPFKKLKDSVYEYILNKEKHGVPIDYDSFAHRCSSTIMWFYDNWTTDLERDIFSAGVDARWWFENPCAVQWVLDHYTLNDNIPRRFNKIYNKLSRHPTAIDWLKENKSRICWKELSGNPHPLAIRWLCENPDEIDWVELSLNTHPYAIELLRENPEKIDWSNLCANHSLGAIEMIAENPNQIDWERLSANPFAIELLTKNPSNIEFSMIVFNSGARELILANQDQFEPWNIEHMTSNPCMFDAVEDELKNRPDRVDMDSLLSNPEILEYDYAAMWRRCMVFKEDLMKNRFHPDNVAKFVDWGVWGNEDDEYDEYEYEYVFPLPTYDLR